MIPILSVLVQGPVETAAGPLVPRYKGEKHTNCDCKRKTLCCMALRLFGSSAHRRRVSEGGTGRAETDITWN
jgi:hypothetical protein